MKSIRSYYPVKKKLLVLEHSVQDGETVILGLEAVQNRGELDVSNTFVLHNISELSAFTQKYAQARLVITDDNVLTKKVSMIGTDHEILSEAFPNLNLDDFYYQVLKTSSRSFVAVCRKQYVTSVVEHYQKEKIRITQIAFGQLSTTSLGSWFQNTGVKSYNGIVQFGKEEVISIGSKGHDTEEIYQIEDLQVSENHIAPLAFLFESVSGTSKVSGNIEEQNIELKRRYNESRFFKNTLQYGIGALLISLLINFFWFNSEYKVWQQLQEEIRVYTTQKESITKQQSIVDTKEAVVKSIMTTGFSKSSYLIDQIIQVLPSTILLESFTYQPLSRNIRTDKPIRLMNNIVNVIGNSSDKEAFTEWLRTIEDLPFVEDVTITNYGMNKKNQSSFEINIYLANETTP